MNQLGGASPLKHVRGFFYPVKEKPEIQAALDELEGDERTGARPVEDSDQPHQLTD
jgi:hypothetical protein